MNLFTKLLISLALVLSPAALANGWNSVMGTTKTIDSKRNVNVLGSISVRKGLRVAKEIYKLATVNPETERRDEIYLTVNSPGGSVVGGWFIIDAMSAVKTQGHKVVCVTGVLAASMAFNILAACDERWSLPNAQLLWHPARIFTRRPVTADVMETWTEELKSINGKIKDLILESSEMDEDYFDKHDRRETLHPATNLIPHTKLYWINAVTHIKGSKHILSTRDPRDGFSFRLGPKDEFDWDDNDIEIVDDNMFLREEAGE